MIKILFIFATRFKKRQILMQACGPETSGDRHASNAGVVELVDTLDLGSSAERCESSSLSACTN